MAIKKSVRLVDESIKTCRELSHEGDINWSGSINNACERYQLFVKYCMPELSQAEKNAIAQAYNGHWFDRNIDQEAQLMHWQIGEAIQYDQNVVENLAAKDIDPENFLKKIKSWTNAERLAVIAFVNQFWNGSKPIVNED